MEKLKEKKIIESIPRQSIKEEDTQDERSKSNKMSRSSKE